MENYYLKQWDAFRGLQHWRRGSSTFFLCVCFTLFYFGSFAFGGTNDLQKLITGQVTDEAGMPLPGVSILIKDADRGAVTDFDGEFSIEASENEVLVISFMGFKEQEIVVKEQVNIDIVLLEDVGVLDEIVVVGYGSQSKRNVTGAISSIDMANSENDVAITESLSGVAGLQFNETGRPGEVGNILIRGQNSLNGDNTPLIVLDGIIFNGSLNDINPQDIQSMEVLKDASSTAIYGSRASNGVILITSKKGTTQKPTVKISAFHGTSEWSNKLKLLSPERYIQRRLDWRKQSGLESAPSNLLDYISATEAENYQNGISSDPWDKISQQASTSSLDLSVSARNESSNYYLSASLADDKGLIYNDNQQRSTFRANVNSDITDWLALGLNATYSHRDLSGQNASIYDAYRVSPLGNWYYEDGHPTEYPVPIENAASNPMRNALLTDNEEISDNLFSNFYVELDLPFIPGLTYRTNFSPSMNWRHNYSYMNQDEHVNYNNTNARKYIQNEYNWVLENIITYEQKFGSDHDLSLTLLYGRNHYEMESTTATANQFNIGVLGYNSMELGSNPINTSFAKESNGVSYMARINYGYMDRYLFTLTARRDGSSVFSTNNKYATFPSGAFSWIASDEAFLDNVAFVDLLKLRASYGSVGNQAIDPYQSLTLSDTERVVYGKDDSSLAIVTSTLGNEDLTWETTYMANFGLDFELFDRKVGGSIELYHSKTEDLLVRQNIPVMNGYNSILTNIGQVNNQGIELVLNTENINTENFQWNSSFTFSHNKNEIVHLFGTDLNGDGREDDDISNSWFIGEPINSFYDYQFDGIYQVGDNDIPAGSEPGFVRVKDLNGDGVLNAEDRTVVGSGASPEYQLSLRNSVSYRSFTLSVFMNAMLGWEAPFNLINPLVPGRSLNQLDAGWWTSENQSNSRPSLAYSNPLGTNWYLSRNFFRIQDITLSYDFDSTLLESIGMSSLRIYVSGKNLYTATKWLGPDPENGGNYLSEQGSSDLYPMPRTFMAGLNLSF